MITIKHVTTTLTREEKDTLLAAAKICEELDDLFRDVYDVDFDGVQSTLREIAYQETFTYNDVEGE